MDEQTISRIEQLLEDTHELVEENNRILMNIQRTQRWSFWGKVVLWILLLGLPILLLGPLLKALVPVASDGGQNSFGLPSQEQVQSLIEMYQATSGDSQ